MNTIAIIPDTNVLFSSNDRLDFNRYDFNKSLKNVFKMIEELSLEKDAKIILPEIVWLEIIQQRKEYYLKCLTQIEVFNKNYSLPNIDIIISEFNFQEHIDTQLNDVLKTNIDQRKLYYDMPINIDYEFIVNRAINKSPPFEGKDKNSDKGFKDAILWESILKYKEMHRNERLVFYTNDGIFNKVLNDEFCNKFNENIEIIQNEIDLRKYLSTQNDSPNPEFEKQTEIYSRIKAKVFTTDTVKQAYREWMENRSAYGPGIQVVFIDDIEVEDISIKEEADFQINSDYYIKLKLMSRLRMHDMDTLINFNPVLHLGANIIENQIVFDLEGIEGALRIITNGAEIPVKDRIPYQVYVDFQNDDSNQK